MAGISTAWILFVSVLLFLIFAASEPDGFIRIVDTFDDMYVKGMANRHSSLLMYFVAWSGLCIMGVYGACISLSAYMSKSVISTVERLQWITENIRDGNLDFEVISEEDKEVNELCLCLDDIKNKLREKKREEEKIKEERNMLMANLSHDMGTPVATIIGYMEGIRDGVANNPEKYEKYMNTIYDKAKVLQKLVDNMSAYSELELGRMQYVFEYMDIGKYLRDICESFYDEAEEKGFFVEVDIIEKPMRIAGDKIKLKRVFDNILSNAMKYNTENGKIRIKLEEEQNGALISVCDTGFGIKDADKAKIFDGFYRGDAARSNIKGNGLGLGISKQIVESHHGKIWIKSEENVGTDVFVYLPLRKEV